MSVIYILVLAALHFTSCAFATRCSDCRNTGQADILDFLDKFVMDAPITPLSWTGRNISPEKFEVKLIFEKPVTDGGYNFIPSFVENAPVTPSKWSRKSISKNKFEVTLEFSSCEKPYRSCRDVRNNKPNAASGIYTVKVDGQPARKVYCEMSHGGGWTVIQRRVNGEISFIRTYKEYQRGFGYLSGEFWIGNDFLHALTKSDSCRLRVDLENFNNEKKFAEYKTFEVKGSEDGYKLTIGAYNGTATDNIRRANNMKFSAIDKDQDGHTGNCAQLYYGGWWYDYCHESNPNGLYLHGRHSAYATGINWRNWEGYHYSLKSTRFMVRC